MFKTEKRPDLWRFLIGISEDVYTMPKFPFKICSVSGLLSVIKQEIKQETSSFRRLRRWSVGVWRTKGGFVKSVHRIYYSVYGVQSENGVFTIHSTSKN